MTASAARTRYDSDASFDARWARWQEAGAAQARALDQRIAAIAVLTFCALATSLAIAVYLI